MLFVHSSHSQYLCRNWSTRSSTVPSYILLRSLSILILLTVSKNIFSAVSRSAATLPAPASSASWRRARSAACLKWRFCINICIEISRHWLYTGSEISNYLLAPTCLPPWAPWPCSPAPSPSWSPSRACPEQSPAPPGTGHTLHSPTEAASSVLQSDLGAGDEGGGEADHRGGPGNSGFVATFIECSG